MKMNKFFPTLTRDEGDKLLSLTLQELESLGTSKIFHQTLISTLFSNPSKAMPYHGNIHTILFVRSMVELINHEPPGARGSNFFTASSLIHAALYHDYDYQGAYDDSVNIDAAVRAWRNNRETDEISDDVEELIRATNLAQMLDPNDPLLKEKQLMRDADILGWQYLDYADQLIDGLREEKGIEPYRGNFTKHFEVHTKHARKILDSLVIPES